MCMLCREGALVTRAPVQQPFTNHESVRENPDVRESESESKRARVRERRRGGGSCEEMYAPYMVTFTWYVCQVCCNSSLAITAVHSKPVSSAPRCYSKGVVQASVS